MSDRQHVDEAIGGAHDAIAEYTDQCQCSQCTGGPQRSTLLPPQFKPGELTIVKSEAQVRKDQPLATGCLDYFPDALTEVAELSRVGNEQHNPGSPLHWDRSKSGDEADALLRHLRDRGTRDTDGVRHSAKVAWRSLALLQKEIEADRAKSNG